MGWFVPENVLDSSTRYVMENYDISKGNICISGYLNSGKSLSIMYISRKIARTTKGASILILVFRNIDADKFKTAFREL